MGGKWVMGLIGVIALVAVGGIGFAAYTSTATVTVNASAGSFYLTASAVYTAESLTVGTCTVSTPSAAVTVSVQNLLPGDYCNFTATYVDSGSLPGTFVSWTGASASGVGCGQLSEPAYWIVYPVASVAAGGTAASFWWNVTDVGNGQVSGSCNWSPVTVTYAAA